MSLPKCVQNVLEWLLLEHPCSLRDGHACCLETIREACLVAQKPCL